MLRTIVVCEKNIYVEPPRVLTLAAATATELFPTEQGLRPVGGETFTREVQNVTGADLYLSFGVNGAAIAGGSTYAASCDNLKNWHVLLADGQIYNIPDCVRVCAYSASGGTVSCIRRYRADMIPVN